MVGDVDRGEGLGDFAHMVSHPGESAGKVFDIGAKEYSDGVTIAARVEDAFVAFGEADIHFVDSAIGKSTESESSGASAFAKYLLELEGALGSLDDASNDFVVKAEAFGGFAEGASGSEVIDHFALEILRHGADLLDEARICRHSRGLYHG